MRNRTVTIYIVLFFASLAVAIVLSLAFVGRGNETAAENEELDTASVSAPSDTLIGTSDGAGAISEYSSPGDIASVEDVTTGFVTEYFTQDYMDSETSRRLALEQYATDEFLSGQILGFDTENILADKAFVDNETVQTVTGVYLAVPVIEGNACEVAVAIDIRITSDANATRELSRQVTVYLARADGAWKVVDLDEL